MAAKRLPLLEEHTQPIAQRIATGLHKVGLAMKQQAWHQANEHGLSATQGQILAALVSSAPLTGTELSARLGLTLPTISDSVAVLVDKNLVAKSPDPRHPRASLITLTPTGRALGVRARSWPEFLADAVGTLTPVEQEVFFTGIVKMIRSLQDQGLVPVTGMCVTCTHFQPNVRTGEQPHHCGLVDAPIAIAQLRLDCVEQQPAPEPLRSELWDRFTRPG
ncbi:MAG: winged helix-turn-helix transcriptional regulator [Myxococcales bacterium]|nr:winged helix-turn-helix transcriptional regulator [Myxococcales bacterium]